MVSSQNEVIGRPTCQRILWYLRKKKSCRLHRIKLKHRFNRESTHFQGQGGDSRTDDLPFLPRSLNAFLYLPENTVVVDQVIFLNFPLIPFTDQGDLFFSLRINYIQFNFQLRSTFVPRQNSTQLILLVPNSRSRNIPEVVIVRRGAGGVLGIWEGLVNWVKGGANGVSLQATWEGGGRFLSQLEGAK